ncbi:MAG: hypothetical protein QMD43_01540 [Thermodesulfovibrio sp.]|uniref:flagellar biosynthesis protein FlhF n=1 Tax=unclassified Thermodesulfovibrio TaxID=2645936 RepID=UPI00083A21E9|nr:MULTISPECIES: hypothetical protein [unclassified Thermodesulfovibrio]MDI1471807.1 hypothetical protein [Thermodesulfovibrio sp. 1176]MDI6713697.1 hypothetical protein [Thermodesulfovibrio sp.]ODA44197.1 Flagellar biosynthesis protein FlhF [Thermodesulfovibrio sp. N1]
MKIKKFQGKSFKEVLETVKKELGPDAVIISSITKKDPLSNNSLIEITAAFDDSQENGFSIPSIQNIDQTVQRELEKIKIELALLRESVTHLFPSLNDNSKASLYNFMIKIGIEPHLALMLLEKVSDINELRNVIEKNIKEAEKDFEDERGFVFFGLPGVGKTTTLFKLGQSIRAKNQKIMILSLDQRISSVAYIKQIALSLKCDAKIVKDLKELYKIIHRDIDRTKILIDTPGDGNISSLSELKDLLKDVPIKKCLLMDASMSAGSSLRVLRNNDSSKIDCIAFSKIDLAHNYGNLYNIAVYSGKPISFITSGDYYDNPKIYPPRALTNFVIGGVCEN